MKIQLSGEAPPIKELTEILKRRFSNQYTVRTFGLVKKSILVTKSTLVGAEIAVNENEISVAAHSTFEGIFRTLGHLTGLVFFFVPFFIKESSSYESRNRALQNEVGAFLKRKFC